LKLWSVREATYATAAYPLTNSVELHLEIEFAINNCDYLNWMKQKSAAIFDGRTEVGAHLPKPTNRRIKWN
ncbi:hypothetical protein, partial [Solemya velesiana gill symbiont]|uniref:hypothetical protein n=1 Tax=Solemya velesiana gill symbiont TaxID=1918948 RepID=UPI001C12B76D